MITLLVGLVVLVIVVMVLRLLLPSLGLPSNVVTAILLIVGLVFLLWLFGFVGSGAPLRGVL